MYYNQLLAVMWSALGVYLCYRNRYYFAHWREQSWVLKGMLLVLLFHTVSALALAVLAFG